MGSGINWISRRDAVVKDRSKIERAAEIQDEIRLKSGEGELSSEIRKWRDKRK
jgi:hypothetical protein